MIYENKIILRRLNELSDTLVLFLCLPLAYWLRFSVLTGGIAAMALSAYLRLAFVYALAQTLLYALLGLYPADRGLTLARELRLIWLGTALGMAALLSWLFLGHAEHYSRLTLAFFYLLSAGLLSGKRLLVRRLSRRRQPARRVLLLGSGRMARRYLRELERDPALGYAVIGYLAPEAAEEAEIRLPYFGDYQRIEAALEESRPDEVVCAPEAEEFQSLTPQIVAACEKAGVRLSIIPFYAEYLLSRPHFDDLNGIPLLNLRRIPLDNRANALCKRALDLTGAALGLVLCSPLLLIGALGVRLSSPGPVLFRQERLGKEKKPFTMYKLRTMRANGWEDTAWSGRDDPRRTRFGAFLRKYSIDELPQLWNVLRGDMSLVGPRPEIPYHAEHFQEEIPLYMVKHQVRPGMTGWAQVNGLRGDTSIRERIEHDIYYIENWSLRFDLKILWITVFRGKFVNDEII